MGKGFLDDNDDDWCPPSSKKKQRTKRKITGLSFPDIDFLSGLEWYDYIMIPLLTISAIMIILNFTSVMEFFLILTVRLLDLALLIFIFIIIICIIVLLLRRPRW